MAIFNLNKTANIEIEKDLIKYRVPLIEYESENIIEIEKDIKRKVAEIENEGYYLTPFKVENINSSVIYFYDVVNYKSFLYIRQFDFKEKLKYFTSLVEIAKRTNKTKVTWAKENFVLDPFEEKIKAITYETKFIKMKEKTNALEGVKELILISLTNLDSILGKPRRVNFLDQDDDIINFAETILLKIDNLDDLDSFIQTKIIEYEYEKSKNKHHQENENEKRTLNIKRLKPKQRKKQKSVSSYQKKNKSTKEMVMYGLLGVLLLVGIFLNFAMGDIGETPNEKVDNKENIKYSVDESNSEEKSYPKTKYDDKILTAYRYSLSNNNKKALSILEEIGYDNLNETDQQIMLSLYVKVIELSPEHAKSLVNVNELIADKRIDKLREIYKKIEEKERK